MDELTKSVASILTAIVGVAILSVLVSRNANTAGVISAGGSAFATALNAATGPVSSGGILGGNLTGNNFNLNGLNY